MLVVVSDVVELVNVSCIWHATVAVDLICVESSVMGGSVLLE